MIINGKERNMGVCESCTLKGTLNFDYEDSEFQCKEATFSHDEIEDSCYYYEPEKNAFPMGDATISFSVDNAVVIDHKKTGL